MKRLWTPAVISLVLLGTAGCTDRQEGARSLATDTLTRRQKDSLVSTMPIPGAGGVGRAMEAADRAEERARALDEIP